MRILCMLVSALLLCGACARSQSPAAANAAAAPPSVASLYPLEVGWKWAYSVTGGGAGADVLAIYTVVERSGGTAVVQSGDQRIAYQLLSDGLTRAGEMGASDYLLKAPVTSGATWPIAGGRAKVIAVAREVSIDAGRFIDCVTVEEERSSPHRVTRTTYAPGTGPIEIELLVDEGAGLVPKARAVLRGVTRPGEDPMEAGS